MAINPLLLNVKPISEITTVDNPTKGHLLFYDGSDELKKVDIIKFQSLIGGIAKPLAIADATPTTAGWYKPTTSGTYANAGGLVAQVGYDTLFYFDGTTWSLIAVEIPINYNTGELLPTSTNKAETGKSVSDYVAIRDVSTQVIGKNKFNPNTITPNTLVNESGIIVPYSGWATSEKIYIKPNTSYAYTPAIVSVFDENDNMILRQNWSLSNFMSPSNASYVIAAMGLDLVNTMQIEEGISVSAYEHFTITPKLDVNKIENYSISSDKLEPEIPKISKQLKDFAPNFYKKWLLKNNDVTLVLNGESISTTNYYAEAFSDAKNRPPLMTEKNYTAFIEEALRWEGQKYFRFDNVGIFTEVGTATTKEYDKAWDWTRSVDSELPAANNRPAITRILEGNNCSVSYVIPTTAKRCDFIFRTDYLNAQNAVVAISVGNGKVQIFDENTNTWVEANGYSYSAKEDGVLLPNSLYKSMYQKRLKMRKVNINDTNIRVTITNNGSGRLTYWGYQTSVLDVMFDFILSARGGHSISRLENFESWDTDYFKPDLILWQVPIINEGLDVGNADFSPKTMSKTKEQYALNITNKYAAYKSKSYAPDVVSFMLWFGMGNNGIDSNNSWVFANDPNGNKVSIPTYIYHTIGAMESLNQNVIDLFSIIKTYAFEDAKNKGTNVINAILEGSGIMGSTFTIDGVHYNTNGNAIVYKMLKSFFGK